MKERFAFKIKIGLDFLHEFATQGLTATGQNRFFHQHDSYHVENVVSIVGTVSV